MRTFSVKVDTTSGRQVVEVRATGRADAARKALWRFVEGLDRPVVYSAEAVR